MRLGIWLALMCLSLGARAAPSLGVAAGLSAAPSPMRAAPSVSLSGALGLGERWQLGAALNGWTHREAGTQEAGSEGALALTFGVRQRLSPRWSGVFSLGPALVGVDRPTTSFSLSPGLYLEPMVEFGTRRPTLALQLGARGLWFEDGLRLGAVAGFVYTFR